MTEEEAKLYPFVVDTKVTHWRSPTGALSISYWCEDNIGAFGVKWCYAPRAKVDAWSFMFVEEADAMMFKIRWVGE